MTQQVCLDRAIAAVLGAIEDPEVGINIVDLGLVYEARREANCIHVTMTTMSRSCPLGEFMIEEARTRLWAAFPDVASVQVELVWTPPWGPERMTELAQAQLSVGAR